MSDKPNVIDHLTGAGKFRTQIDLAQAAGVKQNTISDKKRSNSLTHAQMRSILREAPAMGVHIEPADFFPELVGEGDAQDAA